MRRYLLVSISVFLLLSIGLTAFGNSSTRQTGTECWSGSGWDPSDDSTHRIGAPELRTLTAVYTDDTWADPNQVVVDAGGVDNQPYFGVVWYGGPWLSNSNGFVDHWTYFNNTRTDLLNHHFHSPGISDTTFGMINPRANDFISAPSPGSVAFLGFFLVGIGSLGRKRLLKKNG